MDGEELPFARRSSVVPRECHRRDHRISVFSHREVKHGTNGAMQACSFARESLLLWAETKEPISAPQGSRDQRLRVPR